MSNYDKSLIEVWDWKDKVYKDIKDMSAEEYVEKLKTDADKVLSDNSVTLTLISMKKKHHKVA